MANMSVELDRLFTSVLSGRRCLHVKLEDGGKGARVLPMENTCEPQVATSSFHGSTRASIWSNLMQITWIYSALTDMYRETFT